MSGLNWVQAVSGLEGYNGYPSQKVAEQGNWEQYEWIVVCGALAAFFMAWGIGANDVANAFGTSVGSKAIKLWQACIIAGIFEFTGAMVLGGEVTKTIATDIVRVERFNTAPEIYMYGMLCALTAASIWLLIATYSFLAVSTTHSIIGACLGFGLVYGGIDGVKWNDCKPDFPWSSGMLTVFLSWFVSPVMSGILSTIIFLSVRTGVLRRKNSTTLAFYVLPALLFLTFFINIMFVLSKGAKKDMEKKWPPTTSYSNRCTPNQSYKNYTDLNNAAAWIGAVCGAGVGIVGGAIGIPLMRRRYMNDLEAEKNVEAGDASKEAAVEESTANKIPVVVLEKSSNPAVQLWNVIKYIGLSMKAQLLKGLYFDVHSMVSSDERVSSIHESAEVFDPHTEQVFKYLQVFSACCVSFSHGSNDVANSVGPFAGIWFVYKNWQAPTKDCPTPKWIFVLGGLGLVVGLMTYGYNIIMELGVSLLKLTPSRGFSAELATGLTISIASSYGLPVSTTQIIVGAETGVGLCESVKTGVNFPILLKTFLGWVLTIIIAAITSAAIFSMGIYAPSIMMSDDLRTLHTGIANISNSFILSMNKTNTAYFNKTQLPGGTVQWQNNSDYKSIISKVKTANDALKLSAATADYSITKSSSNHQYIDPEYTVYWLAYSMQLYKNFTLSTVGQNATLIKSSGAGVWKA